MILSNKSEEMKHTIFTSAFALSLAFAANANGQTRLYTLDECVNEALANNLSIQSSQNSITAAEHDKKEAFTNHFPTISAMGGGYIASDPLISIAMGEATMEALENGYFAGLSATLPVYAGGQITNGNRLANVGIEVAKLQHKSTQDQVRLQTEQYFWQIVMLKSKIETLDAVDKQLEALEGDVQNAVDAGVTNKNDLLQVRLKRNQMRSNRATVVNAVCVMQNLLAQQIGHAGDSIDIVVPALDSIPSSPEALACDHQAALEQTNEYGMLEQNVKAQELQRKMAMGKNLPTVAVGGSLVLDKFDGLDDQQFGMGFATVSIPLTQWWGGSNNVKKQKLNEQNAQLSLQDNSQKLVINMDNTWNDLNTAYTQVQIAIESIEQANENLRLQTDYYQAGTCTMSDLLEAQTLYANSRDSYSESIAQYEIKCREYLKATGR